MHKFHVAQIVMIPNKTIMCQWNFDVDTVACVLRVLVGNLSVDGGSWWFSHVCTLGLLFEELLS